MKRISLLIIFEIIISAIAGYLMSLMSFIGRMGINLVRTEYKVFKTWWKTALIIFCIQIVLIFIQWIVKRGCTLSASRIVFFFLLLIGVLGLAYTYYDFSSVFEHRLMKDKFHLGGYLFWIGWISSNLYFLVTPYTRNNKMVES